jgi:hypothetical protein
VAKLSNIDTLSNKKRPHTGYPRTTTIAAMWTPKNGSHAVVVAPVATKVTTARDIERDVPDD